MSPIQRRSFRSKLHSLLVVFSASVTFTAGSDLDRAVENLPYTDVNATSITAEEAVKMFNPKMPDSVDLGNVKVELPNNGTRALQTYNYVSTLMMGLEDSGAWVSWVFGAGAGVNYPFAADGVTTKSYSSGKTYRFECASPPCWGYSLFTDTPSAHGVTVYSLMGSPSGKPWISSIICAPGGGGFSGGPVSKGLMMGMHSYDDYCHGFRRYLDKGLRSNRSWKTIARMRYILGPSVPINQHYCLHEGSVVWDDHAGHPNKPSCSGVRRNLLAGCLLLVTAVVEVGAELVIEISAAAELTLGTETVAVAAGDEITATATGFVVNGGEEIAATQVVDGENVVVRYGINEFDEGANEILSHNTLVNDEVRAHDMEVLHQNFVSGENDWYLDGGEAHHGYDGFDLTGRSSSADFISLRAGPPANIASNIITGAAAA